MKAVMATQFGGPNVLQVKELGIPEIETNQVLIRVMATSVNFADISSRNGKSHRGSPPPFIPGLDAAGIIESVGREVSRFSVGQRVIAFPKNGSYAEYVVADENLTFVIPDALDFQTAAACPIVSFTSYKLLANVAKIEPGETVLVHAAAGGIGTTAVQMAKLLGAGTVIGTVGSDRKISVAQAAGADYVVSYDQSDFAKQVNEWTEGKGADIILDAVGGTVSEQSLDCLARFGRIVLFGTSSGSSALFNMRDLHASCRSVLGFSFGTTRKERPHMVQDTADQVLRFLSEKRLKLHVSRTYALEEAAAAHTWVEGRHSTGKVLLEVR